MEMTGTVIKMLLLLGYTLSLNMAWQKELKNVLKKRV